MRVALVLFLVPTMAAGCLDADGEGPGGFFGAGSQTAHREPWVVLDRDFTTTNVESSGGFPFELDQSASQLQVVIEYGPSAFSGFRFTAPDSCVAASPGAAFYSNSGQSAGACDALDAGTHELAWTLDAGSIQGHITLVAFP